MFYTFEGAREYLGVAEKRLQIRMCLFSIVMRSLPGMKGMFLSKRDVEVLKKSLEHPTEFI